MMITNDFQTTVIAIIQRQYPDIRINISFPAEEHAQLLYIHTPNSQLSIGELRFIAQASEVRVVEAEAVAQRILTFMTTLIDTLENNEACRLSWTTGITRGRVEKDGRINLRELETQINILGQLVEECKHGVTCKSDLTDLLDRRRGEIFRNVDDVRLMRNIRQLRLPQLPENYQHLALLSDDSYEIIYESILQKLLIYQNVVSQFLRRELGFDDFQRICYQLMRQDIVLLNNNKTNELIRYTWSFCTLQYMKFTKMRAKIKKLRHLLIQSIVRAFYIAFQAKIQIQQLDQSLNSVQGEILGNGGQKPSNLGRNSVVGSSNGQEAIVRLQNNFTSIFNYLTQRNQTIFINFYERKLKKRVTKLLQIEDRLTHFFKIIFNPDYAQTYTSGNQQQRNPQQAFGRIEERFKQVWQLWGQLKPMNEKQFKVVFEQIQRLGLFVEDAKAGREWEYKLIQLEKQVMNDFLFDRNGERKVKKDSPMERFSKSRILNDHNKSFNSYEVNKDEVFEDTIEDFNQKRLSATSQQQQAQKIENIDRYEVYKQGKDLIDNIRPEFGEEFMDLTNFKAYMLTKLIKKVQTALSNTPYSQQPLYLYLASLIENLNIIPSIIKPEINEKKIDLIFFPKVNSKLFSTLKVMMIKHQDDLSATYLELSNNAIKSKNLTDNIKGFMESRLRYLHVLLENIDKLEEISISVDSLNLKKISYDITSEATYNLILKLLLASKEIKAYQDATRDRISNKNLSAKALKLLSEFIYPNFLNSLLLVFQNNRKPQSPQILQALLELSDSSKKVMDESEQYMETIIRMMDDVVNRRTNVDLRLLLQEYSVTLRAYNSKAEQLINQCYNYACINSDALNRQRIRILQFLELIHNGPRTTAQIINQKSKRLQAYLAQLPG